MKKIEHKDILTIEDYKAYKRQKAREWYLKNKEKKDQYSRDYYYNVTRKSNKEKCLI